MKNGSQGVSLEQWVVHGTGLISYLMAKFVISGAEPSSSAAREFFG
jgi:hypothetical protein